MSSLTNNVYQNKIPHKSVRKSKIYDVLTMYTRQSSCVNDEKNSSHQTWEICHKNW